MEIIIFVAIVIAIILIASLILWRYIRNDIIMTKLYNKANKVDAKVVKQLETKYLREYGSSVSGFPRITVRQYEVEYELDGKKYSGILQTKRKDINVGDITTIRYIIMKDKNTPQIITDVYKARLNHLILGTILGVLLAAIIIIFELNTKE